MANLIIMKKKSIILLFLIIAIVQIAYAENYGNYVGLSLGEALTDFCKKNPDLRISFIYNELENYKVKETPKSSDPMQVLRSLVAMNPVSLTIEGEEIYIESRQRGKYKYVGNTIDGITGEPVSFATVLLQNPKDSTTITYGITDENGYFSIPCDRKNVQARFSSVGYKTLYLKSVANNMGNIKMNAMPVKLGEITKTADSRFALNDRMVFLPTQREKKAAQDGYSLLRFMGIPSVTVIMVDNSIRTLSGEGVAVFIDYERAGSNEIQGLLPQDVKRVEILDYPSDPRFEGVTHAVNFIMVKYEYGGYVKPMINQRLDLDYGYYSISSKYSKENMTYDVYTGLDHFKADREYCDKEEDYGLESCSVEVSKKCLDSATESNEAYLSGRIKYATDKTNLSNQLAIRYNFMPEARIHSYNSYSPALYPNEESFQMVKSNSLIPSWRGNYQFSLGNSFKLMVTPAITFSRNFRKTNFTEEQYSLGREVSEKVWDGSLGVTIAKYFGKHSLSFSLNGELHENRLKYVGDNPAEVNYNDQAIGGFLRSSFKFGILRLQPSVKFFYEWTHFDEERYNQCLPGYYISGSLNFNKNHQMGFSSEMSNWTIGVSYRSPNIVIQDNIKAVKGNPSLKHWLYNSANIDYTYFLTDWLSLGAYATYKRHTKPIDYLYVPVKIDGRDMLLQTYIKDGYYQIMSEGISAVARLFDNSLNLQMSASVSSYRKGGGNSFSRTVFNGELYGIYYLRDFYFQASYQLKERGATQYEKYILRPSYYSFSVGFNIKGWNIDASVRNPFRSDYFKGFSYMDYYNYKGSINYYGTAYRRNFWLTATYSFKYGKKVKEEGIDRGSSAASGIVK